MNEPIVAVDFDGTIVPNNYPHIDCFVPGAEKSMLWLTKHCRVILWTMRTGRELHKARAFLVNHNIYCWEYNENPEQKNWAPDSKKQYAKLYIDDLGFGMPLYTDFNNRFPEIECKEPWVNWFRIMPKIRERLWPNDTHWPEAADLGSNPYYHNYTLN